MSILYRQTVVLPATQSSVAVTLDHLFSDTAYIVKVEPPYQTSFWVTSKTTTGFTLNVGTTNLANQTFSLILFRE